MDQAWAKVDQVYRDHGDLITASKTNPLFFALGTLTLRAWEMRMAWRRQGPILSQLLEPQSVARLRALRGNSRPATPTSASGAAPLMLGPGQGPRNRVGESEGLLMPQRMSLEPDMDVSQIDWETWQSLIDGHMSCF